MRGPSSGVFALTSLCLTLCAAAAEDPRAWLERMEQALATRNYRGTFVHAHDGQTDTLRIIHRVSGGDVSERIVSLDGSAREFIRHNSEATTYFPEQQVVLVETVPQSGLLPAELQRLDTVAARLYQLSALPPTRVSGRVAQVISVDPQDNLRYGYRVWIDASSAMPLRTQLRTAAGEVIEQIVFTELTLPTRIADGELQPQLDARAYRWLRHDAAAPALANAAAPLAWQAEQLPAGFRLTANTEQTLPGGDSVVTHLVYSDGLAAVSVFVESQPTAAGASLGEQGAGSTLTSVGSSSALSTLVDGHRVTVIGEVPPGTVRAIGRSLHARRALPGIGAAGAQRQSRGGRH